MNIKSSLFREFSIWIWNGIYNINNYQKVTELYHSVLPTYYSFVICWFILNRFTPLFLVGFYYLITWIFLLYVLITWMFISWAFSYHFSCVTCTIDMVLGLWLSPSMCCNWNVSSLFCVRKHNKALLWYFKYLQYVVSWF